MFQPLLSLRNLIDFPLRQGLRWSRPFQKTQNESKADLFIDLIPTERALAENREVELRERFRLQPLYETSTRQNYRENLYYLELLIHAFHEANLDLPPFPNVADIGVSHWFYVQAFYNFLKWHDMDKARSVSLAGYEVDPFRVYADLRSRYDHAKAHIGDFPGAEYIPHGFQRTSAELDLITLFFPFVFRRDHLRWGLPGNMFAPEQLLSEVWDSLKPGSRLLIVNQGLEEHDAQLDMINNVTGATPITFKHESLFFSYDLPRYVLVSRKGK